MEPKKNALLYLESHIRNMSFNDTWTMVLEALPAGSPINSLQTVNDNFVEVVKKRGSKPQGVKYRGAARQHYGHGS